VEDHLEDAVLRDLITEERSPDERTFRFRHVLIRDVAYATLPKARRADLHRGVADWLRGWAGVRIDEFVEIEAYHLEQAVRLRLELEGRADPPDVERATDALHASASKALGRDDARATLGFAERALALDPPPGEPRLELEWLQVEALRRLGEWRRSGELAQGVARLAEAAGRKDIQGRAVFAHAGDIWIGLSSADAQRALAELARARELLTEAGDMPYLTLALEFLGYGGWWRGDLDDAARTWQEMARVAEEADLPDRWALATLHLGAIARLRGDVAGARELFARALRQAEQSRSRLTRATVARAYGNFLANTDAEEEGEPLLLEAAAVLDEFGVRDELAAALHGLGDSRRRRGRLSEALDYYERALEACMEHVGFRPEAERRLAQVLLDMGNLGRAEEHALRGAELVGRDDVATLASTKMVLGLVREAQGRAEEAEPLLRDAVALLEPTDYNGWEEALSLAEFLLRAGRTADGEEWAARARDSATQMHGREAPVTRYVESRLAAAWAAAAEQSAGAARPDPTT
jgi:tetratricopeptide (TPR) repeat protein